ncbi:ParA family protein [Laribacter hongkongensis]|uniref:AAA family ATPase n=1 Tax=Laribacter hongkongensis TaxID=168471 RepID=A0ABD4SSG2_9NEIS|nr:AAA family ATPase [Laribacter hongkongensis]MCG9026392.1 AAA family ATPase [Laribacter hongkongensis]
MINKFGNRLELQVAKTICMFNHKGGVSKTTTSFNLGWALADAGKKVLLVDLDSQCNLTGLVMGFGAIEETKLDAFYSSRENMTMRPIVDALINGKSPEQFMAYDSGKLLETKHPNLSLLPGHLDVADLDSQISVSLKIASGIPATRNIPGNLPKILQKVAGQSGADYVIYDLSPNVGGLNEVVLMSSDFFIVPCSPDYFCLQAIKSLEKNIKKWKREIERFKDDNDFNEADFSIRNSPIFIGTIHQRYRPRNDQPAKSFLRWIDTIRDEVNITLVPSLQKIGCVIDESRLSKILGGAGLQCYDLAHISDFNSLIAISQQLEKPIFALTDEEIKTVGKVFGHAEETMKDSRSNFLGVFQGLAERVLMLTN